MDGGASALGGAYVVLAAGTDNEGAWVAYLGRRGARGVDRSFLTGIETPDALTESGEFVAVADLEKGKAARVVGALVIEGIQVSSELDVPRDASGRAPEWLALEFDGEEALHAAGLVPGDSTADAWSLVSWDDTGRWRQLRGTPTVYAPPGEAPEADATMNGVVVAGHLAAQPPAPGTTPPLALWAGPDAYAPASRWKQLPMRPAPDAVSDVACWDLGCWVAGVRDGRPVVLDHDQLGGRAVATPPAVVESGATVLIARTALPFGLVIAVETREGNELWVRERRDTRRSSGWRRLAAPEGDLTVARSSRKDVYLLVDGRLWHGDLDGIPAAN